MARETRVKSQVESYQRLKKWYLIHPCLTLSIIRCVSRVKWINPGKGVSPSPKPLCRSCSKGSVRVALDYGHQLYLYVCVCVCVCVCSITAIEHSLLMNKANYINTCIYIYIYIERERERERGGGREKERLTNKQRQRQIETHTHPPTHTHTHTHIYIYIHILNRWKKSIKIVSLNKKSWNDGQ